MKIIRLGLALMLAACFAFSAAAESAPVTKESVITLEGMQETLTLTLYEGPRGYRLWYDANMFALATPDEGSDIDAFVPQNPDAVSGVGLYINYSARLDYTLQMAREDVRKSLEENGYTVTEADAKLLFPNNEAYGFHAVKDMSAVDKYVVAAQTGEFYITLEYPLEAAEGFGARLLSMAATFELEAAEE